MIFIFVFLTSASAMAAAPQPAPFEIAQTSQVSARTDRTIGVCHLVNSLGVSGRDDPLSPVYIINPSMAVRYYHAVAENKEFGYENNGKVTLLQGPEQGTFEMGTTGGRYRPNTNFIGSDRATFLVEIGGIKVKVVYHFKVIDGGAIGGTEEEDKQNCPKGRAWKISLKLNDARSGIWA